MNAYQEIQKLVLINSKIIINFIFIKFEDNEIGIIKDIKGYSKKTLV